MSKFTLDQLRDWSVRNAQRIMGWTAHARGIHTIEQAVADRTSDGRQWLFDGPVPIDAVRDLIAQYRVVSHPLSFVRPAMPWDDPNLTVTIDGQSFTVVTDDSRQIIADSKTDRVHFVPKDGYKIHDFEDDVMTRLSRIIGSGLIVDSAMVLNHGAEFVVATSTDNLETTPEGVSFYSVLFAASSHNGTLANTLAASTIMPECDNTTAMALGQASRNGMRHTIKHTSYSAERLAKSDDETRAALGLLTETDESFAASVAEWCALPVTDGQFSDWLTSELFPIPDDASKNITTRNEANREIVTEIRNTHPACAPYKDNAWGVLNAANTFDLWERGTRGENSDPWARAVREVVTGKANDREASRADSLMRILANA